jgi:hypothetical protein
MALLLTLSSPVASAASLLCKNENFNVGDLRVSVVLKCGEPVFKESFCKPEPLKPYSGAVTAAPAVVPCSMVDEYTYNPGYGQFMTTVRFEAGRISLITYGERAK